MKGNTAKILFLTKDSKFMFVYSREYNTVFGISLTLCQYIGIKQRKILRLLNNAKLINDISVIDNDMKRIIGTNTHYILPLYDFFNENSEI